MGEPRWPPALWAEGRWERTPRAVRGGAAIFQPGSGGQGGRRGGGGGRGRSAPRLRGSERGSRRPKMAAAAGDVRGAALGARPGLGAAAAAAAEARFISSAKVSRARRAAGRAPFPASP